MYNNLLERIPRGLPRRAKTLMLLHNSISEIGRNDLALLFTLTELNLSYNKLTTPKIHRDAFRKLRILETLDLSGNRLQIMPLGLPRSLRILSIKNNELTSIPHGAMAGMEKLQKLILSENHLKLNSVYQGAWMELSALTVRGSWMHRSHVCISNMTQWSTINIKIENPLLQCVCQITVKPHFCQVIMIRNML